jgi:alkylated DNA nucleotide flippase Atl1
LVGKIQHVFMPSQRTKPSIKRVGAWQAKLEKVQQPEVKPGPEEWNERYGGSRMLISTPQHIQQLLETIPKGRVITMSLLRQRLAREANADYTCPLTTGIFLRIVAEATEEKRSMPGPAPLTPWWRVLRDDGTLLEKGPGAPATQASLLEQEDIRPTPKGKRQLQVQGHNQLLAPGW